MCFASLSLPLSLPSTDKLCFNSFFHNEDMQEITKHFVVCHVDAPGQQIGASQMPQGYITPKHTYMPVHTYTYPCTSGVLYWLECADRQIDRDSFSAVSWSRDCLTKDLHLTSQQVPVPHHGPAGRHAAQCSAALWVSGPPLPLSPSKQYIYYPYCSTLNA